MNPKEGQFDKNMLKLYFSHAIERKARYAKLAAMLDKQLSQIEKYITLEQLFLVAANVGPVKKIVQSKAKQLNTVALRLSDKVLPLKSPKGQYLVYQTPPIAERKRPASASGKTPPSEKLPIWFAFLCMEDQRVVLLRAFLGRNQIEYTCSYYYDLYGNHKDYFLFDHLSESTSYGTDATEGHISIMKRLLEMSNHIKTAENARHSESIRQQLAALNGDAEQIEVQFDENNEVCTVNIAIGERSVSAAFCESTMLPVSTSKPNGRMRIMMTPKGWANVSLLIVKTREPGVFGRTLYVVVHGSCSQAGDEALAYEEAGVFSDGNEITVSFVPNQDGKYEPLTVKSSGPKLLCCLLDRFDAASLDTPSD